MRFISIKAHISVWDYPRAHAWMDKVINEGYLCIGAQDFLEDVVDVLIKQVGLINLPLFINLKVERYTHKDGYHSISYEWGALIRRKISNG